MKKSSFVLAALFGLSAAHEAQALFGRSKEREDRGFSCEKMCTKTACDKNSKTAAEARAKCMEPTNNCSRDDKQKMGKYRIQDYRQGDQTNWDQFFKDACSGAKTDLNTSKPKPAATTAPATTPATTTPPTTTWTPVAPTRPRTTSPTNAPPKPNETANPQPASNTGPALPSPAPTAVPSTPSTVPPLPTGTPPTPGGAPPVSSTVPPAPTEGPPAPAGASGGMNPALKDQIQNGIKLKTPIAPAAPTPQGGDRDFKDIITSNPRFKSLQEQNKQDQLDNETEEDTDPDQWK